MKDLKMIDRRYFDILILALEMKKHKENGDNFRYEALLFRLALSYHEIFKGDDNFNIDRGFMMESLSEILPQYFANCFDKYGQMIP